MLLIRIFIDELAHTARIRQSGDKRIATIINKAVLVETSKDIFQDEVTKICYQLANDKLSKIGA